MDHMLDSSKHSLAGASATAQTTLSYPQLCPDRLGRDQNDVLFPPTFGLDQIGHFAHCKRLLIDQFVFLMALLFWTNGQFPFPFYWLSSKNAPSLCWEWFHKIDQFHQLAMTSHSESRDLLLFPWIVQIDHCSFLDGQVPDSRWSSVPALRSEQSPAAWHFRDPGGDCEWLELLLGLRSSLWWPREAPSSALPSPILRQSAKGWLVPAGTLPWLHMTSACSLAWLTPEGLLRLEGPWLSSSSMRSWMNRIIFLCSVLGLVL